MISLVCRCHDCCRWKLWTVLFHNVVQWHIWREVGSVMTTSLQISCGVPLESFFYKSVNISLDKEESMVSAFFDWWCCLKEKHTQVLMIVCRTEKDADIKYQWRVEFSSELSTSCWVVRCLLIVESWMLSLYSRQATKFYCFVKQVTEQLKPIHANTDKPCSK